MYLNIDIKLDAETNHYIKADTDDPTIRNINIKADTGDPKIRNIHIKADTENSTTHLRAMTGWTRMIFACTVQDLLVTMGFQLNKFR